MEKNLKIVTVKNFTTENGKNYPLFPLSFQLFGPPLHTAPIVLVNHALTGNSNVVGEDGWWNHLVGTDKTIDTNHFTILAFNIPGNGYDGVFYENYLDFNARDVASLFIEGIRLLQIEQLYAIIGGSIGGGIGWEMIALASKITKHLIPIASDWKSTDWLIANCYVQQQILLHSSKPIEDARAHAMLCYRTPESFQSKFNRTFNEEKNIFNIESWLAHHGDKLQKRFQIASYLLVNQLLKTIDITRGRASFVEIMKNNATTIHVISIDTDLFFTATENQATYATLKKQDKNIFYQEIQSIHGHDAFLIEYEQLNKMLEKIFKNENHFLLKK